MPEGGAGGVFCLLAAPEGGRSGVKPANFVPIEEPVAGRETPRFSSGSSPMSSEDSQTGWNAACARRLKSRLVVSGSAGFGAESAFQSHCPNWPGLPLHPDAAWLHRRGLPCGRACRLALAGLERGPETAGLGHRFLIFGLWGGVGDDPCPHLEVNLAAGAEGGAEAGFEVAADVAWMDDSTGSVAGRSAVC